MLFILFYNLFIIFIYLLYLNALCNLFGSHLFSVCVQFTTLRKIKCTFYQVIVNK